MPEQERDEERKFKLKVVRSVVESHESHREGFDLSALDGIEQYTAYIKRYFPVVIANGDHDNIYEMSIDIVEGREPMPALGDQEVGGMGR